MTRRSLDKPRSPRGAANYGTKQLGSRSLAPETVGFAVFTPMPQLAPFSWLCATVADQ